MLMITELRQSDEEGEGGNRMREKGASQLDRGAHRLMAFWAQHRNMDGRYRTFYHEERLYSVFDTQKCVVSLVFANNPQDAIQKVKV